MCSMYIRGGCVRVGVSVGEGVDVGVGRDLV